MSSEIINGEYRIVPERTLGVLISEIKLIESETTFAVMSGAIKIGQRLKEAKEQVEHGQWEKWCDENLSYSTSWAAKLMRISEEYGDENSPYLAALSNQHTCAELSVSKALRLLSVPPEKVEEFAEVHDVGSMTVKELEAEIKSLKEEQAERIESYYGLQADNEKQARDILELEKDKEELIGKLDKAKLQRDKYKNDLAKAKEDAEASIDSKVKEAVAEVRDEAMRDAQESTQKELDCFKSELSQKSDYIAKLEKQLAQSNSEELAIHKVKLGIVQDTVNDILVNISKMTNPDERKRLSVGLGRFLVALASSCEQED